MKLIDKIFKPKYPAESAGRKMVSNVPTVKPEAKIIDVQKKLFQQANQFETLNYIYVIDQEEKLIGVFSIKDVFRQTKQTLVKQIMEEKVIKARPHTDQERIALLALEHNLKSIPIVDKDNLFLGIVPSDVILEILNSEAIEDILRFAGISKHNNFIKKTAKASPMVLSWFRLPWLIFGLFGGLLAAQIVNFFEDSLRNYFVLAAFIPLIVYMADAVGVQAQTLFIRNLSFDLKLDIKKYFFREFKTSIILALILGFLLGLISVLLFSSLQVGAILAVSLFLTVISASLIAVLIPWLLQKLKKDPAIGSGPFATIIRDVLSLIIYFSIALLMLKIF
jgi:magnesium transporter